MSCFRLFVFCTLPLVTWERTDSPNCPQVASTNTFDLMTLILIKMVMMIMLKLENDKLSPYQQAQTQVTMWPRWFWCFNVMRKKTMLMPKPENDKLSPTSKHKHMWLANWQNNHAGRVVVTPRCNDQSKAEPAAVAFCAFWRVYLFDIRHVIRFWHVSVRL